VIIIIGPKFFGYCEAIAQNLRYNGIDSEYVDELPYNNAFFKSAIRLFPAISKISTKRYHAKVLKRINSRKDVSKIIYISTESITKNFINGVREHIKQVAYAWDSINNKTPFKAVLEAVEVSASFDPSDCERYGYTYVPLFAEDMFTDKNNDRAYSFALIGSAHTQRAEIANNISLITNKKSFLYLYSPSLLVFLFRNKTKFFKGLKVLKTKPMSKREVSEVFKSSKFVVDFAHPGQSGLTQRTFEAIRAGALLITNNKTALPFLEMNKFVIQVDNWDLARFEALENQKLKGGPVSPQLDYDLSINRFCNQILEI
tara:strand:+ start:2816 stop:3760 length:945 start_codon:yes stop_codon:yes gene_type:complete